MLESLPVLLAVATALGFLAGLGVGGGSLLILWLTLVLKIPADTAAGINLLFFVPTAVTASLFRLKQGKLDFPRIFPALLAGVATAGVLTVVARSLDTELLRKPFGILLLLTGLRELLYRRRKAR
jgi:uncharacterized membrane protein YfcA